ncbi:ScyD/ScyE family protein [Dyadobacter sp. CY326]|uniref:ScyD/ScyE family protein n=1 Tax=Dyadobacter sp. CY326 TaxID=2907300 RepID=UPI001F18E3DC|nr:ScyD/ScyE family protein [Dyadobacter sp. CY326]MCE7065044.1 ScyD/ScyE family protein [Dyadobacter sp. CY326]
MKKSIFSLSTLLIFLYVLSCTDHLQPFPEPQSFSTETIVRGLKSPVGLTLDDHNNIWVTEAGTGNNNNDGSVSMITPSGSKTTFVTGLASITKEGSTEGIGHILFHKGKLYFLHGANGILYTADIASFKAGDAPIKLTDIPSQDIGTFARSLALTNPLNANTFDLTFGPDDHLYIVDSGSNAIIKRDKSNGTLSLFAHFPDVAAGVETVPTGIVYDGSKFLLSSLTGFPFAPDAAKIFQVDNLGNVSTYQSKFTTLTGITLSVNNKPIVIQHGVFGQMGFGAKTGRVLDENGKTLLGDISRPTDIIRAGDTTYLLLSYQDGTISKLSY